MAFKLLVSLHAVMDNVCQKLCFSICLFDIAQDCDRCAQWWLTKKSLSTTRGRPTVYHSLSNSWIPVYWICASYFSAVNVIFCVNFVWNISDYCVCVCLNVDVHSACIEIEMWNSLRACLYRRAYLTDHTEIQLDASNHSFYSGSPYVFGFDPVSSVMPRVYSLYNSCIW